VGVVYLLLNFLFKSTYLHIFSVVFYHTNFFCWFILPRFLDDPWIGGTVLKVAACEDFLVNPVYIFGSAISDVLHVHLSPVSGSSILLLVDCCLLIIGIKSFRLFNDAFGSISY
jgi:hypothetical protein